MAFPLPDRVAATVTAVSATAFTVSSTPIKGYQTFETGIGDQNFTVFCVYDASGNWEVTYGRYTSSNSQITRRVHPLASSNGGNQVGSWGTGIVAIVGAESSLLGAATYNNLDGLSGMSRYWGPICTSVGTATNSNSLTPGTLFLVPVYIGQYWNSALLQFEIVSLPTGAGTADLGIWSHYGGGPLKRVAHTASPIVTGGQGGGATGLNQVSMSMDVGTMPPGYYWVGMVQYGSPANITRFGGPPDTIRQLVGWGDPSEPMKVSTYTYGTDLTVLPIDLDQSAVSPTTTIGGIVILVNAGY